MPDPNQEMKPTLKQDDGLAVLEQLVSLLDQSQLSINQVKEVLAQAKAHRTKATRQRPHTITATTTKASKAQLGAVLQLLIEGQGLTHIQASRILKTSRVRVTNACLGKVDSMSLDALLDFVIKLGQDVTITIRPKPAKQPGHPRQFAHKVTFS